MISLQDVLEARERIAPFVRVTPLEQSQSLEVPSPASLHLKFESLQWTGSFKPRGAFNQMLMLDAEARKRGIVAVSGGNFAKAVAYAGNRLDIPTVVCMPEYTPSHYVQATETYGALVELCPDFPSTFKRAEALQRDGLSFLHAWDNPNQMAGNGTIGLEILDQLPDVTDIFISIGGGGLLAGITIAVKSLRPDVHIWGVETAGSETMGAALQAGKVVQIIPKSMAKTLGAPYVAADALTIAQQQLEGYLVVTDEDAIRAQRTLLEREKLLTELAASCTLSAFQQARHRLGSKDKAVLLLCGGNETLSNIKEYARTFPDTTVEATTDAA